MADVPASAKCVVIGAGIVGNSLVHHLAKLGWTDIVQIDQGPLPNPGGSTGHASNFIFLTDHSREITDLTLDSVVQYKELGVFTQCGGFEVARTEERMEELRRRMSSAKAWGIEAEMVSPGLREGEGPLHRGGPDHRRLLAARRRRGRLPACRHDHARRRHRGRRADHGPQRRGHRPGRGGRPHPEGAHRQGRHRGGVRRHRLRRVEPEDRRHGRREHPARARRAPDDQRRPLPAARGRHGRDQLPDRPRHGHVLLRAPARRRHGGRLLRAPRDPHGARGHPDHRAVQALPDRAPLHRGGLRPAAGAGLRADAGAARRRGRGDPLRDQRPALADLRRLPDPGRVARQGPVDRLGRVDQGGSGRRPRGGRVDGQRPLRDRRRAQRHRPLPPPHAASRAHPPAHHRVVHQDLRHRAPLRAVRVGPPPAHLADVRHPAEARRRLLRDRRLGAPVLVRVERRSRGEVRRRRDAARARVGLPLVEPDHQRRAPRHARERRRGRPVGVPDPRHRGPGRARDRAAHLRRAVRRRGRQGHLHPGARPQGRLPVRPHRHAAR